MYYTKSHANVQIPSACTQEYYYTLAVLYIVYARPLRMRIQLTRYARAVTFVCAGMSGRAWISLATCLYNRVLSTVSCIHEYTFQCTIHYEQLQWEYRICAKTLPIDIYIYIYIYICSELIHGTYTVEIGDDTCGCISIPTIHSHQ